MDTGWIMNKQQRGFLFRNIAVLSPTTNGSLNQLDAVYVAISGDTIIYVGDSEQEARTAFPLNSSYDLFEGAGRLLMPAFANAHNHIAMTLMRNSADDLNLNDWLFKEIIPREETLTGSTAALGTKLGLCEMIRGGIGATADMYLYADRTVEIIAASGMRGQIACEAKSTDRKTGITIARPHDLDRFITEYDGIADGRIRTSLGILVCGTRSDGTSCRVPDSSSYF